VSRQLQKRWSNMRLAGWCNYRGISQAELARRTGLSEAIISRIANGKAKGGVNSFEKLADALNISIGCLP
jgi:transcriptional regulator with XRE-family HTH domain